MLKSLVSLSLIGASLTSGLSVSHADGGETHLDQKPGFEHLDLSFDHRARNVSGVIWYPVGKKTYGTVIGQNAVFKGTAAMLGAGLPKGKYPLILVSHGSGGNQYNIGWLGDGLVKAGYIVAGVNHQGSTSGDSSPRQSIQHWTRAQDLSALLDSLMEDPYYRDIIDFDQVTALGFSLGGLTSLQMAGAKPDLDAYKDYCKKLGSRAEDCVFFAKGGVDLDKLDAQAFSQSLEDPRFSHVVAIDPAMTYAMDAKDFHGTEEKLQFISLGNTENRLKASDVSESGSDFMGRLPGANYVVINEGDHFSFLGECNPMGAKILEEEQDDPICDEPVKGDRLRVQAQILDAVTGFIGAGI